MWQLVIPIIGNVLDKIFPDKTKADEAKAKLIELQMNGELQQILGQLEINKAEAQSDNVFVSGWRPYIGWVCGTALAYQYLIRPIATWVCALFNVTLPPMPGLDDMLWQLMFGMLGMGGLRTIEKIKLSK